MDLTKESYTVNLASLREGHNDFVFRIDGRLFDGAENTGILDADVAVRLDINRRPHSYDCDFSFAGRVDVACDRCLEPVAVDIDTGYALTVRHGGEYDDSGDGMLVIPESWTQLDMGPIIRDTLLLEIPLRCVHPDGQCDSGMESRLREHGAANDDITEE